MTDYQLELIDIVSHGADVKSFRFALKEDVFFRPGQYLVLTLPLEGRTVSKAFSISSSPTEKGFIQFTKKLSQSPFSMALEALRRGESCHIRFPLGNFTFYGQFPRVAFLVGGIGITPVRSIFRYAADLNLASSAILLYSSRSPEYLIFREELSAAQKANPNLKVIYTLTECFQDVEGCRKGYIDEDMVKQEIGDYAERVFYSCGPPAMVDAMRRMLNRKLSVPQDQIVTEDFVGY
ncbi:MAG: FAD-dependent oxidoreductase [Candidatus Omnitrophota bacterium]